VAGGLRRFLNLAAADAGRANTKPLGGTFDNGPHRLQVQIPAALGNIVGVADLIAELRTPATHFANSCHYEIS
jgi:hypothetical protein